MNLQPPLCLDSNTIVLDSTGLETFKTCPRKFYHEQVQRRIRAGAKPALDFGKALHAALEVRYKQCQHAAVTPEVAQEMHRAIDLSMAGIDVPQEEWRTLARAHETVDLYNAEWSAEPFEVLGVEVPFAVPLGTVGGYKVVWTGRIDLLVRWEGAAYVLDHKTMSMWGAGKSGEFDNSAQFRGYAYAMQALHKLHGDPFPALVAGFCLNALVLRKPSTSSRTTLPRTEFHRTRSFYSQERLEEWRTDMLAWVQTLLDYAARDYMPMNTRHCASFYGGNCPMLDVCVSPPEQRAMVLASDLYEDNVWTPLDVIYLKGTQGAPDCVTLDAD